MKPEEFQNSTSGRLVRTSIFLTSYWAFVPNPLPPGIVADWDLVTLLSEADHQLGIVAGLARNIPEPAILIEPFMRREAVLSSRIEGTHTVFAELMGYESGHLLPGYSRNYADQKENQEVFNYVQALKVGLEWIKTKPVSLEMIKTLHRTLLSGVRGDDFSVGEFREMQNFIGRSNEPDDAVFIPVPVEELHRSLKAFEAYLKNGNKYPPLLRIAMLHYQFETIHPFLDGNGRLGRLLIVLLLVDWGLLPAPLLYPSAFFERNRDTYYSLLLNVSKTGDWEGWLRFFLEMIIDQSKDTVRRSNAILELKEQWEAQLKQNRTSVYYFRIIDSLFFRPFFSVSDIEKLLGVTNKAARSMVDRLVTMGIVNLSEDKKYGRVYQADELLRRLGEH